ncbi:MAG: inositol monophosphatase family protein [Alkalispirochaeta sp.]
MTSDHHRTHQHAQEPSLSDLRLILADAIRAARIGGETDRRHFGRVTPDHATLKNVDGDWNPVTHADNESETAITHFLADAYPEHSFLGEENVAGQNHSAEHLWVIDPIDGTVNFIHGIPHYGVAVGYAYRGTVMAAACLDPERDELFTAIRGQGATLNGTAIRAAETSALKDAIVCTGFYYDRGAMMEQTLGAIRTLFQKKIHGLRRSGSAVLDICWTAAGRYDAYFEYELGAWDYAAAGLIAEEAGVRITAADGSPLTLQSGSVACATTPLYEQFIAAVRAR